MFTQVTSFLYRDGLRRAIGACLVGVGITMTGMTGFSHQTAQAQTSTDTVVVHNSAQEGYPYLGIVNARKLSVRCGAGQNYYRVGFLEWGKAVKVHKMVTNKQGNWLAITPPEGTYFLIFGKYVSTTDNVSGVVNGSRVNVRAPSPAGPDKSWRIETQLERNTQVRIVGTDGDWLKIAPMEGMYCYVSADFIKHATTEQINRAQMQMVEENNTSESEQTVVVTDNTPSGNEDQTTTETQPEVVENTDTVTDPNAESVTDQSTSEDGITSDLLREAESHFVIASERDMKDQPIDKLIQLYTQLAGQPGHTEADSSLIRMRLEMLNTRKELQQTMLASQRAEERLKEAERQRAEEERRREELASKKFVAVGKLKTSAVYDGVNLPLRLRLVDQTTQLTVAYVAVEPGLDYRSRLDQLVGLTGETKYDESVKLKVIHAKAIHLLSAAE